MLEQKLEDGDVIRLCRNGPEFVFAATGSIDYMNDSTVNFNPADFAGPGREGAEERGVKGVCRTLGRELERSSRRSTRAILFSAAAVCAALLLAGWYFASGPVRMAGSLASRPTVELDLGPIYSSLFHSYREKGIGEVRVRNTTSRAVSYTHLTLPTILLV